MTPVAVVKSRIECDLTVMAVTAHFTLFHQVMSDGCVALFHFEQTVMACITAESNSVNPVLENRRWKRLQFFDVASLSFILNVSRRLLAESWISRQVQGQYNQQGVKKFCSFHLTTNLLTIQMTATTGL